MNCALALRMLDACIDGELDAATAEEVVAHLAACSTCTAARDRRLAVRAALRSGSVRDAAPPGLRQAILREIAAADRPVRRARSPRWWEMAALGVSTAVLGGLGGWWLAQPHVPGALPELAVAQHLASLTPEGPRIDVASADRHVVRPWFQGRTEFAPMVRDLSAQGFELVGARIDRLADRQAVAVVYRLHGHVINVFSWRGAGSAADRAQETTVRGFNVVTWSDSDLDFAAVSDTDRAELKRFAAAYRAP